jgi:hypothetical protein
MMRKSQMKTMKEKIIVVIAMAILVVNLNKKARHLPQ